MTLKGKAIKQMERLESPINSDVDDLLREMALMDGYDARNLFPITDLRLKDDVAPCEQNEPPTIEVTYEKESPSVLHKALWFVVGLIVVLVLALAAGCERTSTISHDGHLFIRSAGTNGQGVHLIHHPDCPCKRIEP